MKLFKKYGILVFWAVLIADLLLLEGGYNQYRLFTTFALVPILILIFAVSTRRSKHYTKKLIVYTTLLYFGIAYYYLYKCSAVSIAEYGNRFYAFESLGIAGLAYLFFEMQTIDIKDAAWAFLGLFASVLACFVCYKILDFGYSGKLPYMIFIVFGASCLMHLFAFNIYQNKQKKKLAIEGFIPGSILLLISFIVLLGYWFVLYGEDSKIMFLASMLCNAFGLSIIVQNLVKYLKG